MTSIQVKSVVIDWQNELLDIKSMDGWHSYLSLDKSLRVTMVGYPEREVKTLPARELADYMRRGYMIEQIDFEE
jgi:hypothetical protein